MEGANPHDGEPTSATDAGEEVARIQAELLTPRLIHLAMVCDVVPNRFKLA